MADNDPWDLGGGGQSFPFDRIGDEVEGHITDVVTRQGNHIVTNEPEWWDKEETRPKMITIVTLQTAIRDNPKDSGLRSITLSGSKKPYPDGTQSKMCAARTAVLEVTGGTAMEPRAWFKMRYSRDGARTKPNFTPPKGFDAWYRSPVHNLDGDDRTAPANQLSQSSQAGANWPDSSAQTAPSWAQGANTTTNTTGPAAGTLTQAQVEGVRALGGDDAVVAVFGADWKNRVVG